MSTALRTYYRGHNLVSMRDEVAQSSRYYHLDHQGTVQCLTDKSGAVTDRFAADAWGVQVKRTGTSINRHWYVGGPGYYRQPDQRLEYVRARWMDLKTACWISSDAAYGEHPYRYVQNRPMREVDPLGLFASCAVTSDLDVAGNFSAVDTSVRTVLTNPKSRNKAVLVNKTLRVRAWSTVSCVKTPDEYTKSCASLTSSVPHRICQVRRGHYYHGAVGRRSTFINLSRFVGDTLANGEIVRMTPPLDDRHFDFLSGAAYGGLKAGPGPINSTPTRPPSCLFSLCIADLPGVFDTIATRYNFDPTNGCTLSPTIIPTSIAGEAGSQPYEWDEEFFTWVCDYPSAGRPALRADGLPLKAAHWGWTRLLVGHVNNVLQDIFQPRPITFDPPPVPLGAPYPDPPPR